MGVLRNYIIRNDRISWYLCIYFYTQNIFFLLTIFGYIRKQRKGKVEVGSNLSLHNQFVRW